MLHARKDYNRRIQDSENLIGKDEPVFLLRAKDKLAVSSLRLYLGLLEICADETAMEGTRRQITRMIEWRKEHKTKVKLPDCPPEELLPE